jgi:hypothetical protein
MRAVLSDSRLHRLRRGDYEDPECTAEDPDTIADDEERREREPIDEFPTPRE